MARKPRVHYAGALYHVILRGNAGQIIFDDDEDRTQFYLLAQEGIERFGHRIHAFCLMNNHGTGGQACNIAIFGNRGQAR